MHFRKPLALGLVMLLGTSFIVSAQEAPNIYPMFGGPRGFVRQPDTTCACLSDTTMGPSVYCFGARRVIWNIRANSGTCSTLTVQVSNNDTTYLAAPRQWIQVLGEFAVGDSLNAGGGTMITVIPVDSVRTNAAQGFPYKYCRVFVRQRLGVTSNNDCTALCRAKVDSLRWTGNVVWSTP